MRAGWPLVLAKVQTIELKYRSVKNAPSKELSDLQQLTKICSTGPAYELTVYETYIFQRVLSGQISKRSASDFMERSVRWINPRLRAFANGNYRLVSGRVNIS